MQALVSIPRPPSKAFWTEMPMAAVRTLACTRFARAWAVHYKQLQQCLRSSACIHASMHKFMRVCMHASMHTYI
eukprot:7473696-Prorocentrum_lima.AAC.1